MVISEEHEAEYLHGFDTAEQKRLEAQAILLGGAGFLPTLRPGMRVVEMGCGTGAIAREVAARVAPGVVIGVDREEAQLETARQLATARGITNVRFQRGEADALDLPDADLDGAYCRFLLEHVGDPVRVVREMVRVVRPDGWVCAFEWDNALESVYPNSPAHRLVWQSIYRLQETRGGDPWIARKLYRVFREAGLRDVRAEARVWTVTAAEPEKLRLLLDGSREIIRQTRNGLLREKLLTPEVFEQVDEEYEHILNTPHAYIAEGFCRAIGRPNS